MHYRAIEKITKTVANHRRIQILDLLSDGQKLSVIAISNKTRANLKTVDVHVNRLFAAGLIDKHTAGRKVNHDITRLGRVILSFLRKLE